MMLLYSPFINVNMETRTLLAKPMVTTRGFILINENEELISKIQDLAEEALLKKLDNKRTTYSDLKTDITREVTNFIKKETGRKPIVLPIVLNVKTEN